MVRAHDVEVLCDVRAQPFSRRHPHFDRGSLEAAFPCVWLGKELGGLRRDARPDSPHVALGEFRAYADHMETAEFREGIARLLAIASERRTAFLCAEKDWRSCHRSFIADHLVAISGVGVHHILSEHAADPHRLRREARLQEGRLIYDVTGMLF